MISQEVAMEERGVRRGEEAVEGERRYKKKREKVEEETTEKEEIEEEARIFVT